ncbi:MAG: hypothetical protein PVH29_14815, partial [Candidatus Zixiibacteriota bacterium]
MGAGLGLGGRCGFAGVSKNVTAGTFISLKSAADVREKLGRGPAVEQLLDLFEDGYDRDDQALSVQEVIYLEIDSSDTTAEITTPVAGGSNAGSATPDVGGTPWLDRSYMIKVTKTGDIGVARYKICRNYDVVDADHQVWSEELKFVVADDTTSSKIYLEAPVEDPDNGAYIEFTEGVGDDFVADDTWTFGTTPALPSQTKIQEALTALVQWRDAAGNGLGGTGDISLIGCDQEIPADSTAWEPIHQIATDEWDN